MPQIERAFCKYITKNEPFVILKVAATLDGKIATREGDSKWISGEASRRLVHKVRGQVDGVLVGIGTILKDDPLLTARRKEGREPYRIILDSYTCSVIGTVPSIAGLGTNVDIEFAAVTKQIPYQLDEAKHRKQ
jgi:hypothetical protein